MKKRLNTVLATTLGIVIGSSLTAFAGTWVEAYKNTEMSLSINGQTQILRDATTGEREYPLTYNDRTYIPLRSVATLLGYNVDYDSASKTAIVNSPNYVAPETNQNPGGITVESMDASDIPYLKGLKLSNVRPTLENTGNSGYSTDEYARIQVANTLNSVYMKNAVGTTVEIHSQSPFKAEYENLSTLIDIVGTNIAANENMLTYHVSADSVDVLYYVYDSNNVYRGMIASYTINVKNNMKDYTTIKLTSLLLNDENAKYYREGTTDVYLFCDFINQ